MRECQLCGKDVPELLEPYCGRCDKIDGDMNIDATAEHRSKELVV